MLTQLEIASAGALREVLEYKLHKEISPTWVPPSPYISAIDYRLLLEWVRVFGLWSPGQLQEAIPQEKGQLLGVI